MKTYVWLDPERLKFINDNPKVLSLLYDLGLLPEEISARVRGIVEQERDRCAKTICGYCSDEKGVPATKIDGLWIHRYNAVDRPECRAWKIRELT